MIADIERARGLSFNEPRLVRRHGLMALSISLVHTIICIFYFVGGYFASSLPFFLGLFGAIWAGNLLFYTLLASGRTLRWRDPSLAVPLTLWLTLGFLITSYYVDAFRISVLMLFFGAMLLASFRCRFWKVALLSVFACVGYAVVLVLAFSDHGMTLSLSVEGLQWLIFTLSCSGFAVTGTSINRLRNRLSGKNEELGHALEQVREMAIRDELTGLFNRRHIMDILKQQKALADSGGYNFCICYLDLDHFKSINDTWGHGAGDQVLKRFAAMVHDSLREADYTGRLGGEEFVLVLSQARVPEAWQVCERLRLRLANTRFDDVQEGLSVTVSTGIAEYRPGEDIDETLQRADACLYAAKNGGRNQVVVEMDDEDVVSPGETESEGQDTLGVSPRINAG